MPDMKIVITGGGGFIGFKLAKALLARGTLAAEKIARLMLVDQAFPAEAMSLRTASNDNVVIIDTTNGKTRVIGEVDRFAAPVLVHEQAIYLHESKQFQVEKLDWENAKAYVREVKVDYYTDAGLAVRIRVLAELASQHIAHHPDA